MQRGSVGSRPRWALVEDIQETLPLSFSIFLKPPYHAIINAHQPWCVRTRLTRVGLDTLTALPPELVRYPFTTVYPHQPFCHDVRLEYSVSQKDNPTTIYRAWTDYSSEVFWAPALAA